MKKRISKLKTKLILTKGVALFFLFCSTLLFLTADEIRAQQEARIYLEPSQLFLNAIGTTGTMEVRLNNVENKVAAIQVRIHYDQNIVHPQDVTISSSVLNAVDGSDSATPTGPIVDNDAGYLMFGAYNIHYHNIIPTTQRPVNLATIEWQAVGGGITPLSFNDDWTYLINTDFKTGGPMHLPLTTEDGLAQVGSAPTPTPTPQPTSTPTPIPTSTPTPVPQTPTPTLTCGPLGDIDCSGKVNALDFSYLLAAFGTSNPEADLDNSGEVDALDISILLSNFGKGG